MLDSLKGKRTFIGAFLLGLLAAVGALDAGLHGGVCTWFSQAQYEAAGGFVGAITATFLRIGVQRSEDAAQTAARLALQPPVPK
jgi:hypothetical protein